MVKLFGKVYNDLDSFQDARGDQCDKCGRLINAPELKAILLSVTVIIFYTFRLLSISFLVS